MGCAAFFECAGSADEVDTKVALNLDPPARAVSVQVPIRNVWRRCGERSKVVEEHLAKFSRGELNSPAPGRPVPGDGKHDKDFEARRKVAEANRRQLETQGVKPLSPFQKKTMQDLEKAKEALNGEMYGVPVPPTLGELQKWGAKWLTRAFH